jgi:hypothetical protein
VSHLGAELGEAWSSLRRAWPRTRARVSGGGCGVGRVRERVKPCEMRQGVCAGHWRGSKKGAGRGGGRRGREIRRRARVRMRRSTASAERAELAGQAHGAEREERGTRGNGAATGNPSPQDRERERERGGGGKRKTGADRSAPLGSERGRTAADRRGPPIRRRRHAGARPGWAALSFSFSLDFSNSFSISFSIDFQIQIQTRFQIQ